MTGEFSTRDKTVVITGASTGIGRASALLLSREGFRVFAGVRKEEDGEALKREARGALEYLLLEVTDRGSIARAVERVRAETGAAGLWGLFNNAGIAVAGPLELVSLDRFEEQLRVNVTGVVAVTRAFLPMLRTARGRVVITGSESGKNALPLVGPYCASKHAVEAIADAWRIELYKFGIRVSLLEPGSIDTPIWKKTTEDWDRMLADFPEATRKLYRREINAMYRTAGMQAKMAIPPEKVAQAVLHALTSNRPKARYITGLDGKLFILATALIPTAIKDYGLRQAIKLYGKKPPPAPSP